MATRLTDTATVPIVDTMELGTTPHPMLAAIPDYTTFKHLIAVGNIGIGRRDVKWPYGVSAHEDTGRIYVVDSYNHRIQVFSETGDYVNQFGNQHLSGPWGILIHEDSVYVTDYWSHALFLFSRRDLSLVKRAGKKGSGKEEFNFPRQLAISPNELVYVADDKNNRIQILNSDLGFKGSLQHPSMNRPVDVKFSMKEMFVLSCEDNPCVHIFTLSGEKIVSVISRGHELQVRRAYFFCLDAQNNIVISDWSVDGVKVFSHEGDLLHRGEERGHKPGMLTRAGGIAIFKRTKLVCVSSNASCVLQIFYD